MAKSTKDKEARMTTSRRTFTKWLGATAASTALLGHARLAHAEAYKVGFVYVGPVEAGESGLTGAVGTP